MIEFIKKRPFIVIVVLIILIRFLFFGSDKENKTENQAESKTENKQIAEKQTEPKLPQTVNFNSAKDSLLASNEIAYFEKKLQNSFWTKFQQTNKYGKKYGTIETVFDRDKFEEFAKKQGFKETENGTLMDYDGLKNGFHIFLDNNGAVPSSSGWVQKWKIIVQKENSDTIYKMEKEIKLNPTE